MFECFSTWQCLFFVIVTEFLIWDLLTKFIEMIKHCATAKAFRKVAENENFNEWIASTYNKEAE